MDCFQIPPFTEQGSAVIEALSLRPGQNSFQLVCFGLVLMHPSPTAQTLAKSCSSVPPSQTEKRRRWHANCCTVHLSHLLTQHISLYFTVISKCTRQILFGLSLTPGRGDIFYRYYLAASATRRDKNL